jgi:hypothetical protein
MKFIKEAEEQLQRYEAITDELHLHQACEKDWGAVAYALKAINSQIKRHRALNCYIVAASTKEI